MIKRILGALAVLVAFTASPAAAAGLEQLSVYPTFQYFTWKEFDSTGSRLLKEDGPLFGAGVSADIDLHDRFLFLRGRGELFGGQVDYDGQTSSANPQFNGLPVKTDVNYFGGKLESDFSWRLAGPAGHLEPFAGLGYRHWLRNIEASSTQTRDVPPQTVQTGELTEEWLSLYTRLGMRGTCRVSDAISLSLEAGAKYPFLNRNFAEVYGQDITLKPRGDWSAFAELSARFGMFRPAVYYEGMRFDRSSVVRVLNPSTGVLDGFVQPRSEADIFGISLNFMLR